MRRFALLGGTFVGEGALLRFYVLHCVGLPLGIAVLMAVHFWRVRKDGGISGTSVTTFNSQGSDSQDEPGEQFFRLESSELET